MDPLGFSRYTVMSSAIQMTLLVFFTNCYTSCLRHADGRGGGGHLCLVRDLGGNASSLSIK